MASTIMHLAIAKKVNEFLKMDERELYLGTLAPDLSKELGQNKEISHFLDPTKDYDIPDINKFLAKYKDSLVNPFEMGYFIHLLADKYWYRDYINDYIDKYTTNIDKKKLTYAAIKNIIYNDYTNINSDLIKEYQININTILEDTSIGTRLTEVPVDKLNLIVDKLKIIIEESHEDKTFMFNTEDIKEYINNSAKYIIKDIEMLSVLNKK